MNDRTERAILAGLLPRVRRRMLFQAATLWFVRVGVFVLPVATALIAADQRWNHGSASVLMALGFLGGWAAASVVLGVSGLGERVHSALALDQHAHLKDRVSSAWEFLAQPTLSAAHQAQIRDAIHHAESLNCRNVLRTRWPRSSAALPVLAIVLGLSFLVPPVTNLANARLGKDPLKSAQLQLLAELKQELKAKENPPPEIQEVLKKLEEVRRDFEKGSLGERDVMIELGRLDESLRSKLAKMGVENLESELNTIIPLLGADAATLQIAEAIKAKEFDKAAEQLKELAEKVSEEKMPKEDQKKLAAQLGAACSKLGNKGSSDSFSGELAEASKALETSDHDGFASACKSMGDKLGLLGKCEGLKSAASSIGLCKGGLGQCQSNELGYKEGPQTEGNKQGGLKAGTAASGNPFGDPSRLGGSYDKMLNIAGQAGKGPVETETEVTPGQLSSSKLSVKEIYANFAAAAEQVIEQEDIPLSQRYHVKRYLQAIRPQD